ncbi:uncharacterized protein LOC144149260 isoform X1 [Haemaphysalis longicornis]
MVSGKIFNGLLIVTVTAVAAAIGTCRAQDCQQTPDDCDAAQVLRDYGHINLQVTSSPNPETICDHYTRTFLSEDGNTAEYNYTYRLNGDDDTPIYDNVTITVSNNTVLRITFGNDPATVIQNNLLFINAAFCNVVRTNASDDKPYLLFDNPDSPLDEYYKCLNKIRAYANDNITFVRNMFKCAKIPENL